MAELWDAYDCNFNKIDNVTFVREGNEPTSVIPDGMYHLVSEIIVKHTDGTYLLMRRDFKKKYGVAWELTAGGSVLKGENAYEGAVRELKEETGIVSDSFQEIGRVVRDIHHAVYAIYLCINAIGFYLHQGFELIGFDKCCYTNKDIERREVRLNMGLFL